MAICDIIPLTNDQTCTIQRRANDSQEDLGSVIIYKRELFIWGVL